MSAEPLTIHMIDSDCLIIPRSGGKSPLQIFDNQDTIADHLTPTERAVLVARLRSVATMLDTEGDPQ